MVSTMSFLCVFVTVQYLQSCVYTSKRKGVYITWKNSK